MAMPGKYPVHPQISTRGMPSKSTQWVHPCHPINKTQAAQVPQLTLNIPKKGKIKNYNGLNSTLNGKNLKLIPSNNT